MGRGPLSRDLTQQGSSGEAGCSPTQFWVNAHVSVPVGIPISAVFVPTEDLLSELTLSISGGRSPYDGIIYPSEALPDLYALGVLVDIRTYDVPDEYITVLQSYTRQLRYGMWWAPPITVSYVTQQGSSEQRGWLLSGLRQLRMRCPCALRLLDSHRV